MIICEIIVHRLVIVQNKLYSLFVNGRPSPNELDYLLMAVYAAETCCSTI